jgi:hypothetical protein
MIPETPADTKLCTCSSLIKKKKKLLAGHQWLTSIILTQEAEIRKIKVQGQPKKIIHEPLS